MSDLEEKWGESYSDHGLSYVCWLEERVGVLEEAIDTELVCCHIGTLDSMKSPQHALAAIGRWHYDLGASRALED